MKNNGLLILAGGGLLAWLLLKKKDTAGTTPNSIVSDTNSAQTTAVQKQPVVNYEYNEYNTYENPALKEDATTQEVIVIPPVEDQSQIKIIPAEPVYIAPTTKPAAFIPIYEASPDKIQPAVVKGEPIPAPVPAPRVVPSSIRDQSTILTASVKGIDGITRQCMVRPNLGNAVHRASRVIYINNGSEVKIYAVTDHYLLRQYKNYGFHIVTQ